MYLTGVPNRSSPPAVLPRDNYRDGSKVKTRTLANLTDWALTWIRLKSVSSGGVHNIRVPSFRTRSRTRRRVEVIGEFHA